MAGKVILALVVTVFVGILAAVSATMNYAYGLQQGTESVLLHVGVYTITESQIFGVGAVAIDGLKLALPIAAVVLFSMRMRAAAAVIGIIAVCLSFWSIQSAASYWVTSKSAASDLSSQEADQWRTLDEAATRAKKQRNFLAQHRPLSVVEADIAGVMQSRYWRLTDRCTDPERAARYCAGYARLTQERATAAEATRLDAELAGYRKEMDIRRKRSGSDPLSAAVAPMLGINSSQISMLRGGLFSILVELATLFLLAPVWGMVLFDSRHHQDGCTHQISVHNPGYPTPDPEPEPIEKDKERVNNPCISTPTLVVDNDKAKKPSLSAEEVTRILDMHRRKIPQSRIAEAMQVSQSTVSRIINRNKPALGPMGRIARTK